MNALYTVHIQMPEPHSIMWPKNTRLRIDFFSSKCQCKPKDTNVVWLLIDFFLLPFRTNRHRLLCTVGGGVRGYKGGWNVRWLNANPARQNEKEINNTRKGLFSSLGIRLSGMSLTQLFHWTPLSQRTIFKDFMDINRGIKIIRSSFYETSGGCY